jgi:hypothetical protein
LFTHISKGVENNSVDIKTIKQGHFSSFWSNILMQNNSYEKLFAGLQKLTENIFRKKTALKENSFDK